MVSDQTVNVRLGTEVLLDARQTYDPDTTDTWAETSSTSKLHFYWCLISYPMDNMKTPKTTQWENVESMLRVPNVRCARPSAVARARVQRVDGRRVPRVAGRRWHV